MSSKYKLFIIYADEDKNHLIDFQKHLQPMELAGVLEIWHETKIAPGKDKKSEIIDNIINSDIVLLFLSSAYYNSLHQFEVELKIAFEKNKNNQVILIPIIVRPCDFHSDNSICYLKMLPSDNNPVSSWSDKDQAWLDIVHGIQKTIEARERDKNARNKEKKHQQVTSSTCIQNSKVFDINQKLFSSNIKWILNSLTRKILLIIILISGVASVMIDYFFSRIVEKNNNVSKEFIYPMVVVKGGVFTMGSPFNESGRGDDECLHDIYISNFQIGKYEVTQEQWRWVMDYNPSYNNDGCDKCPVESVTWYEIQVFIDSLNKKTGKMYRLPTEQEWEYSANGGQNIKAYIYSGSDNIDSVAWYKDNSKSVTQPVGTKYPNKLGIFDMSGNVAEWCYDRYLPYPECHSSNDNNQYFVIRGSSIIGDISQCRISYRHSDSPKSKNDYTGLRLALDK